jgi:hypothetical protein
MDGSYCKSYDIYNLGIVLLEIALLKRINGVVGFEDSTRVKPSALQEVQSRLLGRD